MTRTLTKILAAGAAITLLLAACGDDDAGGPADTTAEVEAAQETQPPGTEEPDDTEAPATTEAPADSGDGGADLEPLVAELAGAGLSDDEARCAVDAAGSALGADTLLSDGEPTDAELRTIVDAIDGCRA